MPSPKSPPIFQIFVAGKTFLCSPTSTHYENIPAKTQAEKGQALCSRSHRGWVAEPVLNPARQGDVWLGYPCLTGSWWHSYKPIPGRLQLWLSYLWHHCWVLVIYSALLSLRSGYECWRVMCASSMNPKEGRKGLYSSCFTLASSCLAGSSFWRLFLFPGRRMGVSRRKCLTSGDHYSRISFQTIKAVSGEMHQ